MKLVSPATALWLSVVAAKSSIFTEIKEITASPDEEPETPSFRAKVAWEMSSSVKSGDNFSLNLPFVYKFTSEEKTLDLIADETKFAHCELFSGENIVDYSELRCTTTDAINGAKSASGYVTFPFTFNAGMTDSKIDLKAASQWHSGENEIVWISGNNKLKSNCTFRPENSNAFDRSSSLMKMRTQPSLKTAQHYFVGPVCQYRSDGSMVLEVTNGGIDLDCSKISGTASKQFNDFMLPESAELPEGSSASIKSCTKSRVEIEYSQLPAGYRPYVVAYSPLDFKDETADISYTHSGFGSYAINTFLKWLAYRNGPVGGDGSYKPIVLTTVTGTNTATMVAKNSGSETDTIVVTVPESTSSKCEDFSASVSTGRSQSRGASRSHSIDVPIPTESDSSSSNGFSGGVSYPSSTTVTDLFSTSIPSSVYSGYGNSTTGIKTNTAATTPDCTTYVITDVYGSITVITSTFSTKTATQSTTENNKKTTKTLGCTTYTTTDIYGSIITKSSTMEHSQKESFKSEDTNSNAIATAKTESQTSTNPSSQTTKQTGSNSNSNTESQTSTNPSSQTTKQTGSSSNSKTSPSTDHITDVVTDFYGSTTLITKSLISTATVKSEGGSLAPTSEAETVTADTLGTKRPENTMGFSNISGSGDNTSASKSTNSSKKGPGGPYSVTTGSTSPQSAFVSQTTSSAVFGQQPAGSHASPSRGISTYEGSASYFKTNGAFALLLPLLHLMF